MSDATITLPLRDFLKLLIAGRFYAHPPDDIVFLLSEIPDIESYCHIQKPGDLPHADVTSARVWEPQAWRESYERWEVLKKRSSQERVISNLGKELRDELIRAVAAQLGVDDNDIAKRLAQKMIDGKNIVGAKRLGVDITPLVEEIEKLK